VIARVSAQLDPLLLLSATELARRIRGRELTSREVLEAHLRRAEAVNPRLNALVAERFAAARAEADAADARVRHEDPAQLPPLLGVPCTIKESFALTGMPQTAGLVARVGLRASTDAPTVAALRAAGAIPIGVTNTSELCMWYESNNRVYGRSNNPYDVTRIVGGSSGGEGAMVGAGAVPFGLGADVGGSIRLPAFFNGVFGHKVSPGVIPNEGQFPCAEGEAGTFLATGPICRRAEDLWPLVKLLARPHTLSGDPAKVAIGALTVLDVPDDGAHPPSRELREAQGRAADALGRAGAKLRRVRLPGLERAFDVWSAALSAADDKSFATLLANGAPKAFTPELVRWATRRSPHTLPAIALAILERVVEKLPARTRKLIERAHALGRELQDAIGDGVMLYPSFERTAPRHYVPLAMPFSSGYTGLFNVLRMPATQVPLGLSRAGLPLGVQVAARAGNDHLTIAVAQLLERACGGWVPPGE
jgi:fatty acid amide hydrolase 2